MRKVQTLGFSLDQLEHQDKVSHISPRLRKRFSFIRATRTSYVFVEKHLSLLSISKLDIDEPERNATW